MEPKAKIRVAHLSGPNATIQNTPPLVTSNKARQKLGLPPLRANDGSILRYDALRQQRLAAPVKVYVEQFSAHPLERDAAELYGPPDGYIDVDGQFHKDQRSATDKPVYEIELKPEDGLYPLPYVAVQKDGKPWEEECAVAFAPDELARQGFFPDGSRSFEDIDRMAIGEDGKASMISSQATVDFYRLLPPGGYRKGLPAALRTDVGEGDIAPETRGKEFFPYKPRHRRGRRSRA
jgi:L-asparaginase